MKCAIYVRVSSSRKEQKDSLENQKNYFLKYIQDNKHTLYKIYEDVASGTSTKNRSGYLELIEDIKNNKIELVLTKEISRLSRSTIDTGTFTELCEQKGVGIIAANNGIDTLMGNSQFLHLYTFLAQYESENTSLRIKTASRTIAESGSFKGSIPAYGYFVDKEVLPDSDKVLNVLKVRNDYTPDIVRRIFREYQNGKGIDTIARHLTRDNIPTPGQVANKKNAGKFWVGTTIKLILTNRNYTGDLTQCKSVVTSIRTKARRQNDPKDFVIVKNTHQAIIPKSEFEYVQELLSRRSRKQNNNRQSTHLFSNILFCVDCGRGMHFKKNRKGYVCGNYDKNGKYTGCTSHIIREADLESIILNDIDAILKNIKINYTNKINLKLNHEKLSIEKEINKYQNDISTFDDTKSNALIKFCSNKITDTEYRTLVEHIDKKIESIKTNIIKLKTTLDKLNALNTDDFTKLANELSNVKKLNKDILNRLINRIEVKENGDVKIYYRFSHLHYI